MATLTLTVPDEVAQTVASLSDADRAELIARVNAFATAAAASTAPPTVETISYDDYNEADEPVDEAFVAELREAFAEAERVGTIPFEEVLWRVEADDKAAADARQSRRQAAEMVLV